MKKRVTLILFMFMFCFVSIDNLQAKRTYSCNKEVPVDGYITCSVTVDNDAVKIESDGNVNIYDLKGEKYSKISDYQAVFYESGTVVFGPADDKYSKYIISKEIEKRENILNLRVFGIYGFGEDSSRVTGCIINANIKKEPIILNQNVKFSFIWIDDFCKIVEYFLNHKTKEKFLNITPSESIEIVDLAKIVNDFSDYKSEIIVKKSGLNNEYTGDNSKLLNEIGKFDFTSYKDGLKIYYEKQQKNNKLTKS